MYKLSLVFLATWIAQLVAAKDVHLDWNVTWVNAAPDGFERPVIGINGQWPCPQVDVDVGDRLIVNVYNGLGNQSTGVHWHGFHQYHSGVMDGATGVTQCPIAPGQHMQYNFEANQTGTYWYHSHNMGQYPDGFRGALIVHDPSPPFHFDDEFTITLSDWNHRQMPDLLNEYESQENEKAFHGREPLPDSALINDSTNTKIKVEPNKTYLVHVICVGNFPGHTWVFDGHDMTVVEVDGVYVEPYQAKDKFLRIATGQRTSVLIHTKPDTSKNFAIWDTMDVNMMFVYEHRDIPANYNPNVTAWLVYDEAQPLPAPPQFPGFEFVDDLAFVPKDHEPLLQPVDHQIVLDTFSKEINGVTRYTINNETYLPPEVPTIYTANTIRPDLVSNPKVYGHVNPIVVKYGQVVEIVINNHHPNLHPWHLHGHHFQVLQRSAVDGGYFSGYYKNVSSTPVRRDTIMVQNNGHVVIRFLWMLHCHIEWHVEAGLMATLIEAPETFPNSLEAPPKDHYDVCAAYPQPINGNAAGKQGLDLGGANTVVGVGNHGAMYPPPDQKPAPGEPEPEDPQPSSQPPPPEPTATKPNPPHTPHAKPPKPQSPEPQEPKPQPPAPQEPAPQQAPAPHPEPYAPQYYPFPVSPPPPPPHEQDVHVHSGDANLPWPRPNTDEGHAQVNDHPIGPHNPADDKPIVAHSEDPKGPWPHPYKNKGYVLDGDHHIKTHDSGADDLPHGWKYYEQYEHGQ
ncbi:hypothetical protein NUU61_001971 [Penicillium alfredii]|uniref:Conidial pigment biosynthesis oxidase Abr1/brown 1 n=1 Tax=Penicillium alfredii TaxID=1506179 RepID=A0A9W9KFJ4_9EURO|nr:uncharacterized protein NUU61_001971 [Penicillium alfredii]KAJ5104624.1 hypothetical protein NUU61_001971 [Penicillium alfredii]